MSLVAIYDTDPAAGQPAMAVRCSGRRQLGAVIAQVGRRPLVVVDAPSLRRALSVQADEVKVIDAEKLLAGRWSRPAVDQRAFTVLERRRTARRPASDQGAFTRL